MYAGYWYSSNTGYIACPDDLSTCACPPEWYPDLKKPLGAPKVRSGVMSSYRNLLTIAESLQGSLYVNFLRSPYCC